MVTQVLLAFSYSVSVLFQGNKEEL